MKVIYKTRETIRTRRSDNWAREVYIVISDTRDQGYRVIKGLPLISTVKKKINESNARK